jgi:hypothetical protein
MRNDINALRADPRRCACASAKQSHRTAHVIFLRIGPAFRPRGFLAEQSHRSGNAREAPAIHSRHFLAKRQNETPSFRTRIQCLAEGAHRPAHGARAACRKRRRDARTG